MPPHSLFWQGNKCFTPQGRPRGPFGQEQHITATTKPAAKTRLLTEISCCLLTRLLSNFPRTYDSVDWKFCLSKDWTSGARFSIPGGFPSHRAPAGQLWWLARAGHRAEGSPPCPGTAALRCGMSCPSWLKSVERGKITRSSAAVSVGSKQHTRLHRQQKRSPITSQKHLGVLWLSALPSACPLKGKCLYK